VHPHCKTPPQAAARPFRSTFAQRAWTLMRRSMRNEFRKGATCYLVQWIEVVGCSGSRLLGSVDRGCWVQFVCLFVCLFVRSFVRLFVWGFVCRGWIEDVGSRASYSARDAGRAFLARCTLGRTSKARASHLPLPISGISALNRRIPALGRFARAYSNA
jgi:hypothetical protein